MFFNHSKFEEKFSETIKAVFPILAIVLVLCFTIIPILPSILVTFLIGAVLLMLGMLLFNVGVESSMTPIIALILTFFVPKLFTAIAFDSGDYHSDYGSYFPNQRKQASKRGRVYCGRHGNHRIIEVYELDFL